MEFKISASDFVYENEGKLRDVYKIGRKVGEGAFSSVRSLLHRTTGKTRAVKTIHKSSLKTEEEQQMFFREIGILRELDHPNIIKLYEFFQDSHNYYIVTELCEGGELFEKIISDGAFSEAKAATYMRQLLSVIVYLHNRTVVHRDIKPENLMLSTSNDNSTLKIIDFGSAQTFTPGQPMSMKHGTAYYIAPEVLNKRYTEACDLWSTGVCMYIMLCGYPPFDGNTDPDVLRAVRNGRFSFPSPEWDNISYESKDLIMKLLTYDPRVRITAEDALRHPWLEHASKRPLPRPDAAALMHNLKSFKCQMLLQKAILAYIGSQLSSAEEREEMVKLFKSLDADDNGTLSREEIKAGLEKVYGPDIDDLEGEVNRIMSEIDSDCSGEIDYSEFVTAAMNRQKLLTRDRLEIAFKTLDVDGNGSISAGELKSILGRFQPYDDHVWAELIREVDLNGDGEIDLEEFISMMTAVIDN